MDPKGDDEQARHDTEASSNSQECVRRLTDRSWWNERPVWLSDSALLARAAAPEDPLGLAMWVIPLGSGPAVMAPGFHAERLEQMSSSPDGRLVVFADEIARPSIFRLDLTRAQASPQRVDRLSSTRSEGFPLASPDGSRILFVSDRSGQVGLWLSQDGGAPQVVYADDSVYAGSPAWSPTGDRLAWGLLGDPAATATRALQTAVATKV